MAKCEITGKRRRTGNNVSHAHNKTKRVFGANIQKVQVIDENGTKKRMYVSTKAIRNGDVTKTAPRKVLLQLEKERQAQSES